MELPQRPVSRTVRPAAAALVVFVLAAVYAFNGRAINSIDTHVIQHTALALAATGRADLSPYDSIVASGIDMGYVSIVDGQALSSYPLLPALIAAPAYGIALATGTIDPWAPQPARVEAVGSAVAALLVALACGVLCLVVARWRGPAAAVTIAVICGVATPLWSSASQALWSHAPAALLLAIGLALVLAPGADERRRERAVLFAGLALTLAVFCRALLIVFPMGVGLALLRSNVSRRELAMYTAGLTAGALLMAVANTVWLGSPLGGVVQLYTDGLTPDTHGVAGAWSGAWVSGFTGILVSPSRGLLIYTPVVLLALFGIRSAWNQPRLRYAVLLPVLAFVVIWAKYAVWWGGHSFGPRFAADIAIPLAIVAASRTSTTIARPMFVRALTSAAAAVLVAWSIGVQVIGAFYYPAGDWNGGPADVDRAHNRLWDWRDSQLGRTVTSGTYREYRARRQPHTPVVDPADEALVAEADE